MYVQFVPRRYSLVEYLLAKAPGVCRRAELPFEGKNVVVYSLGGVGADVGLCHVATAATAVTAVAAVTAGAPLLHRRDES